MDLLQGKQIFLSFLFDFFFKIFEVILFFHLPFITFHFLLWGKLTKLVHGAIYIKLILISCLGYAKLGKLKVNKIATCYLCFLTNLTKLTSQTFKNTVNSYMY
jgi:hypothetical protein